MSADDKAMLIGLAGFAALLIGIAAIYWPAALVIGGVILMAISYLMARAEAVRQSRSAMPPTGEVA